MSQPATYWDLCRQTICAKWRISLEALKSFEIYRLVSADFLSHDQGIFFGQFIFGGVVLATHEMLFGWRLTAITFFAIDVGGTLAFFVGLHILTFGSLNAIISCYYVGMSAGGFGMFGCGLTATLPRRYVFAAAGAVVAALVAKLLWKPDLIADGVHLVCFPLGFLFAQVWDPIRHHAASKQKA